MPLRGLRPELRVGESGSGLPSEMNPAASGVRGDRVAFAQFPVSSSVRTIKAMCFGTGSL